jgi:GDP-L-fucose synthase
MTPESRIFVAGHNGLVGSAIVARLRQLGFHDILVATRQTLDLTQRDQVFDFFHEKKPSHVFMAAAKVGGILANDTYPVDFLETNLLIQNNVTRASYESGVKKFAFLGSCCIYPKVCPQPIREDYLLTAPLEPTNEWYAVAKIAGVKLCQAYRKQYGFDAISLMPTNLYGPNDNFNLTSSHVLPALIRKFHEAEIQRLDKAVMWGTGTPRREFLYVDDMADAAVFLMQNYSHGDIINVGTGQDISIAELGKLVAHIVGFDGAIENDTSKPDGTPLRRIDVSKLFDMGWRPSVGLAEGIRRTYEWYCQNVLQSRH